MVSKQKPLIVDYDVSTTSETRANLTKILARFRVEGKNAKPILFGSHRKVEAVLVPAKVWQKLINQVNDLQLELVVAQRMLNPQAPEIVTFEQLHQEILAMNARDEESKNAQNKPRRGLQK